MWNQQLCLEVNAGQHWMPGVEVAGMAMYSVCAASQD